jgi:hypothetical protein
MKLQAPVAADEIALGVRSAGAFPVAAKNKAKTQRYEYLV